MKVLSSLRSRMFLASAALAVLCIGTAMYVVSVRATEQAERTLEREIIASGAKVDQLRSDRTQVFMLMARLVADLPTLKAALDTDDPLTVDQIARGYQKKMSANLFLLTNKRGDVLYGSGGSPRLGEIAAHQPAIRDALSDRETLTLLPQPGGILQVVTVPVGLDQPARSILGTVSAGFLLDDALAAQLKTITGSDIAFGVDGQILAATLPRDDYPALAGRLRSSGISRVQLAAGEYEVLPRALSTNAGDSTVSGPVALILRSRTDQLQALWAINRDLAGAAVLAVILATVLSFAVARTITRPLAAITDVMREVAATGDLTQKIAVHHSNRWDDEDARLMATTLNALTDSVARFQREMSQKERLTALGRLSTVIAHEIRNPLMIIKGSLHTLRRPDVAVEAMREAVADIDEEVARLNRIVHEVLDFARPISFELSEVDLNALCRESAAAAQASGPGPAIALELDPAASWFTTDPERLRSALVNILVNARHAANGNPAPRGDVEGARSSTGSGRPQRQVAGRGAEAARVNHPVTLHTSRASDRIRIVIADAGAGMSAADLAHVFDPYFTTKHGGTGLGLPIAKNIVEGLGGTIQIASTPGRGTDVTIELPLEVRTGPRASRDVRPGPPSPAVNLT
jgi:signal transduction histidine kinase